MTERVQSLLNTLIKRDYRNNRVHSNFGKSERTAKENVDLFCKYLSFEKPVFIDEKYDRMGFYRYNAEGLNGDTGNFIPEYDIYLKDGFDALLEKMQNHPNNEFAESAIKIILAVYDFCEKYRQSTVCEELRKALEIIPQKAPQNYYQALVFMKIMIFMLRISGSNHVTLGRFDKYMYPFYEADIKKGVSKEEILEFTEEFFLGLNFDTDLYFGVQQGDNGQSLVLGGLNPDGSDSFNELSEICMKASTELRVIDPKINLRVNKNTPDSLYLLGTEMTKLGIGFPQYSNDDVVIPGLIDFGYDTEDAYNYGVAACWEFIIPGARDIPNASAVNFPMIVNECVFDSLEKCGSYEEFFDIVKSEIDNACKNRAAICETVFRRPNIVESLFTKACTENLRDYSTLCAKYNNFGFHGAGISNAADALAAIKKMIFEEKKYSAKELINALNSNFVGFENMHSVLSECPKMGNNNDYVDSIACDIMDAFCVSMKKLKTSYGGIFRPGTGSAPEYISSAKKVGATADGRLAYTPYSANFSPALTTKVSGPLSVIMSFTKFDLKRIMNGGPLTLEVHDTTFRNEDGVEKVAKLVKSFILLGGHQLQLNAVNRERLLDAQKHPELHKNLIVRVWGWSGYFTELDLQYQNHVIQRTEFEV